MSDSCTEDLGECIFIKKLKISGVLFEGRATQAQKTYQIGQNGLCVLGTIYKRTPEIFNSFMKIHSPRSPLQESLISFLWTFFFYQYMLANSVR